MRSSLLLWLQILNQSAEALETVGEQVVNYFFVVRHEVALVELELTVLVEFSENDEQAPWVWRVSLKSFEKHPSDLVLYMGIAPFVDFR